MVTLQSLNVWDFLDILELLAIIFAIICWEYKKGINIIFLFFLTQFSHKYLFFYKWFGFYLPASLIIIWNFNLEEVF